VAQDEIRSKVWRKFITVKLQAPRPSAVVLGLTWGQPGVTMGSRWDQSGVGLGSTWVQTGVNLHHPTDTRLASSDCTSAACASAQGLPLFHLTAHLKLSVGRTCPVYLLEIESLLTQGRRPGRTFG
jgi:hypothetical protein